MGIKKCFLALAITAISNVTMAGPISTYTYQPAPSWPSQPTWPTQPTMPSQPSWPSVPSVSIPTLSRSSNYGNYYSPSMSRSNAAQNQLETQLNMSDSPELVRSQQLQWQLQQQAVQAQDSAFNDLRTQQEKLGAAPGIAAEEARKQQESALRANNDTFMQQWRNGSK